MPGLRALPFPDWTLPLTVWALFGMRPGREPLRCWRSLRWMGQPYDLSLCLGHDLEPKIFWGHEAVPGTGRSRHRLLPVLIPMGGWCGSSHPRSSETTGAQPPEELVVHLRALWEANTPGRKTCGSLTRAF